MILILIIAIVTGIVISKYYFPQTKVQKILVSIFAPFCTGLLILSLISAGNTHEYIGPTFWENMGRYTVFVMLPTLVLIITLFIALKVKKVDKKAEHKETDDNQLHCGVGKSRVNFEIKLTPEEIMTMEVLRNQNPEKWKDNDLELIKEVKKQVGCIVDNMSQPINNDSNNATEEKCYYDKKDKTSQQALTNKSEKMKENKKMKINWPRTILIIRGAMVLYSVVATTVNSTIATCNNDAMLFIYRQCCQYETESGNVLKGDYRFIKCDYCTFRRRMISNDLYKRKIYNSLNSDMHMYVYKSFDDFKTKLNVSNYMINPFVWLW